jgi:magnesium transporter
MEPMLSGDELQSPVTAYMRQDFPRLALGQTVGEALQWLRHHPPPDRIVYFYVVDDAGRLRGVVPTRRLLLSPPEKPLAEVMVARVVALPASATVLDACEFFIQHRFLALPVVDGGGRLLGIVDVELYTSELSQLQDAARVDDLFQRIGVHLAAGRQPSALAAFRRRAPWLTCNLVGGLLCALLASAFEDTLSRVVAVALFIPVVLNLAESVSSQSVSLTLHLLDGARPTWRSVLAKLRAECVTGLLLGTACGLAVGLAALLWLGKPRVAACLLGGIAGGVAASAVLGLALPISLRLLRLEPRVAAGPVALAGADVITLSLYLGLARWLLG